MTCETVAVDTPDNLATSFILTLPIHDALSLGHLGGTKSQVMKLPSSCYYYERNRSQRNLTTAASTPSASFYCNLTLHRFKIFKKRHRRWFSIAADISGRVANYQRLRLAAQALLRPTRKPRSGFLLPSGTRTGAHRHHKVCRWRCAYILDSVLVVRMHETHRARPETVARTVDRQLYRSFTNQPHFGVHVVVCRVRRTAGRQRRFMYLQRFAGSELAFQNVADLHVVWCSNR